MSDWVHKSCAVGLLRVMLLCILVIMPGPRLQAQAAQTHESLRREWHDAAHCDSNETPVLRWNACDARAATPRLVNGAYLKSRPDRNNNSRGELAPLLYRRQFTCFGPTDTLYFLEVYRRNRYWKVFRYRVISGKPVPEGPQWSFDSRGRATEVLHCETGQISCRRWLGLAYWPNDSLARAGWFLNGQPDSLHQSWYDQGVLRSRLHYRKGRLVQLGGLWSEDGQPLNPGGFSEGEGDLMIYSLNGTPLERRTYRDGRVIRRKKMR